MLSYQHKDSAQYTPWSGIFFVVRWKVRFPVLTVPPQLWSTLCILSVQLHSFSSHFKNHRIFEIGRHLWTSTSPTLCSKHSQLELTTQGCVQSGFNYLQGREIHSPTRPPVVVGSLRHKDTLLLNLLYTEILRPTLKGAFQWSEEAFSSPGTRHVFFLCQTSCVSWQPISLKY